MTGPDFRYFDKPSLDALASIHEEADEGTTPGSFDKMCAMALRQAAADADRLDWIIRNSIYRVMGKDDAHGWSVMDQSNGLSFLVRGLPTYREAIDAAIAKIKAKVNEVKV